MNTIPYFEVNGHKYEIKRNRYIQAEFDSLKSNINLTDEEEIALAKEKEFKDRVEKLRIRKDELYDKYLESFDDEAEKIYNKAKLAYDMLIEESAHIESISGKQYKIMLDIGEKIIIKSLQLGNNGETIRTEDEAKSIWEDFVGNYGQTTAIQFVIFTIKYILGADEEEENPFIVQAKEKEEQKKAHMKNGIAKVK